MVEPAPPDGGRTARLLTVIVVLAVGILLYLLRGVLIPLAVAFFLSYIAMPVVRLGRRLHVPVVLSLLIVILGIGAALVGIGHLVYNSGDQFNKELPGYVEDLRTPIRKTLAFFGLDEHEIGEILPENEKPDIANILTHIPGKPSFALTGVDTVIQGLSFGTLVLLFMVFIVLDRGHGFLDRRLVAAFSKEGTRSAAPLVEEVHRQIESYIITKTGISILTGVMVTLTLMVFGVPYAGLFGVMTFLLNYIPNIGSIIATIPPVLVAFVSLGSHVDALLILLILGAVQFTVGNLLEPVIIGRRMRMNPITVLAALVLWGFLWGIWGMLMAVPITAVIKIVISRSPRGRAIAALMDSD